MESVGTDPALLLISILIKLAVLGIVGYGLFRLFRASQNNKILRASLILIALGLLIIAIIGYAYLGALGKGMSL